MRRYGWACPRVTPMRVRGLARRIVGLLLLLSLSAPPTAALATADLQSALPPCPVVGGQPGGCDALATRCLRDKWVFIFGTSVARQWLFTLVALLRLSPYCIPLRQLQKEACGSAFPGHSKCTGVCGCNGVVNRTRLQFRFQIDLLDPHLRQKLLEFARPNTTAPDLVVMTTGYYALVLHRDFRAWHAAFTHFGLQLRDLVVQVLRAQPNMTVYWRFKGSLRVFGRGVLGGSSGGA